MRHLILVLGAAALQSAGAQSLEQRIASARGSVAFEYTTKPNVCGNGNSISINEDGRVGYSMNSSRRGITMGRSFAGDNSICEAAPARVIVTREGDIDVTVGGSRRSADLELGAVQPAEAVRYLLSVAPKLNNRSADHALMGAAIADGATPWQRMLEIARDNNATEPARKSSLFWVAQEAEQKATTGLRDVAMDDDANAKVRSDALFYLAHRRDGEGVPALIKVVETSKSAKLKKDAIFYLSQSRDPRALDLFEKLLSGK